jgi:uncharacterized protein (TIGR00299 family) protein
LKVAYFDCFSGASGDMLLGSLLDAGLALSDLEAGLARLDVGGYRLSLQRVTRHALTGTHLRVDPATDIRQGEGHGEGPSRPARNLPAIEAILAASDLPGDVKLRSLAVFRRIARAEAAIHGTAVDEVHFHEIGAVDSLVDIVGFAYALAHMGIQAVYSSPLPLGSGTIRTEHGRLPAPAPATLALLSEVGAPTLPGPASLASPTGAELVTPTGAALLTEYALFERPALSIQAVGYGFGTREYAWPNALRVWVGEMPAGTSGQPPSAGADAVVELACNLDDASGELLGYTMDRLLAAGALDVWFTPIQMKKNRPATLLSVLARPADAEVLAGILLRETPTLGVRHRILSRSTAGRELREVETPWGTARIKIKLLDGLPVSASPEFEDCARLARAADVSLAEVQAAATRAAGF